MEDSTDRDPLLTAEEAQGEDLEEIQNISDSDSVAESRLYKWKVIGACVNTLVHSLIGASVFVTLWFAFKSTPISAFQLHIGLCVIGYQLLMSHAILSLSGCNSWSSSLTLKHRRRVHWILQLVGSVAAIAGSAIMMSQKTVNFTSTHGKLALAALVFTCASLINGMTSLYSTELRRFVPAKLSKISHIILGTAAFALSTVCLAFGYIKGSFKEWASQEFAYVMIGVTCTYTVIIIASPCLTVWKKIFEIIKFKIR